MATERVGIEIQLMGYGEAMSQMQNLDSWINKLRSRRSYLKIQAQVDELKLNKKALQQHKVKLQADMTEVNKKIRFIRDEIKRLEGMKVRLPLQGKDLYNINQRIKELREQLASLGAKRTTLGDEFRQTTAEINQSTAAINHLNTALRNAGIGGKSLAQIFKGITSTSAHIGQAMQSMGNALTRMTYPLRMFTSGAIMGAGYKALGTITEGLSAGFERYDIMHKFPRVMKAFGYSAEEATKSVKKLEESVLGLPTGLDEMVDMTQRFTATTGDLKKGTDLAIAANNAFLASMSTDTQKYQGMMQLQDVLGGKDMNAREWNSLVSSMTPAIVKMGESMGYTNKNMDEWIQKVRDGKVANDDFIKTLIKVGTEGGEVAKMAQESKDTWQAFASNTKIAFSRMAVGVIESMDSVIASLKITGKDGKQIKSLNMFLTEKIIPGINKLTESAKNWIQAHPEEITDFFTSLGNIDWKGLGQGFLDGWMSIAKGIKWVADKIGGKDLRMIGRLASYLAPLGSILTVGGGFIKGGRHIIGAFGTSLIAIGRALEFGLGAIAKGLKFAGAAGMAGGVGKATGVIKKLTGLLKSTKGLKAAAGAAGMAKGAAGAAGGAGIKGMAVAGARAFLPIIGIIGGIGIVVTEISGFTWLNSKIFKGTMDNIEAITGQFQNVIDNVNSIKDTKINKGALQNAVNSMWDVYDILYGEKTGQKTRAFNKSGTSLYGEHKKGFGDMEHGAIKDAADSMKNLLGTFKSIDGIFDMISPLTSKLSLLTKSPAGMGASAMEMFKEALTGEGGILETIKGFSEDINKTFDGDEGTTDISSSVEGMQSTFKSIGELAGVIPELQKQLAPIMARGMGGMGFTPLESIKNALTGENGVFAVIGSIYESMENDMLGGAYFKKGNLRDIGKFDEAMTQVKGMFTSLSSIINMFPELQVSLGKISNGGGQGSILGTVKLQLVKLMQDIGAINTAVNTYVGDTEGLDAKMDALKSAIGKIKSVVSSLTALGNGDLGGGSPVAFNAINQIKSMITRLGQALNTDTIGLIQQQVAQFKAAVDQIFETLNGDLDNVEVKVQINGSVTGHDKLIADIKAADRAIRNAVNGVQKYYYRTIRITLHRSVSVTGTDPSTVDVGGGGGGSWPHTGGMIPRGGGTPLYRAKGGEIFKPKGTDTVPAMLTPGEYVHRGKAVDFFGVRFMQRINHLDVAGAFRELSTRFGTLVGGTNGTTITNNTTYNNSPTINQNINTNNPNFAFKRSNRYVMALR